MFGVDFFLHLVNTWGYLGVFFAGFFSTFTLFLPSPTFIAVFLLGSKLNPLALGVIGGAGAAIGEMVGYAIGYGASYGASKLGKNYKKRKEWIKSLFEKYKPPVIIFIFSAAPVIPFDFVGLFCGAINYDKKKFFIVTLAGKMVKYTIIAYAGYYGITWSIDYLNL